jgi:hypothetical protein
MMVGASYAKHHSLLKKLEMKKGAAKKPFLRINYTVNPDNLLELLDFFDAYGDYTISTIQIRPFFIFDESAYKKDLGPYLGKYNAVIDSFIDACRKRNIRLLANREDPIFTRISYDSIIHDFATRYVRPNRICYDDFDWRKETHDGYCKRTGLRRLYLKDMLSRKSELARRTVHLRYDVIK